MATTEAPRLPRLLLLAAMLAMVAVTCVRVEDDFGDSEHHSDVDPDEDEQEKNERRICYTVQSITAKPVPKCCPGWENLNMTDAEGMPVCKAVCEPECINGVCKEPNVCECYPNHMKKMGTPMHVCLPRCNPSCVNGECVGINVCRCKPGYESIKSARHMCQPAGGMFGGGGEDGGPMVPLKVCSPPCGAFSRCVGFQECECVAGYGRSTPHQKHCKAICDPPCGVHASCTAPGTCTCLRGFSADGNGTCVAACEGGCENGDCVAPNVCECNDGFEKLVDGDDEVCVPECAPPCGPHGECIATDKCVCDKGHELSLEGDCVIKCRPGTFWLRASQSCVSLPTKAPTVGPVPRQKTTLRPTKETTKGPPPPPPPPPPPTQSLPSCVPKCVFGLCTSVGKCECARGWAGENCSRPCALLPGSTEFDASDCPELVKCTCLQPMSDGKSCTPGTEPKCQQAGMTSEPGTEMPQWLIWAIAGGIVGALILFVVVPSAVAMQLRHNKLRSRSQDKDVLHPSFDTRKGRSNEADDQWTFMPN